MTNNDILRRIRYIFDYNDTKMIALFASAGLEVTREQICNFLLKEEDPDYVRCSDNEMAIFLNGLINEKRGKKDGLQAEPEWRLNNNIIFRKLKIALNMRDDQLLDVLQLTNFRLSKHELSAFFRKPGHKHFRECKDQVLRNFLKGLQLKYRAPEDSKSIKSKPAELKRAKSKPAKPKSEKNSSATDSGTNSGFQWKPFKPRD